MVRAYSIGTGPKSKYYHILNNFTINSLPPAREDE